MVYDNHISQDISNLAYGNETFRARHGFKEGHVHDPPQRRNYDFKPIPYGTARGIPNYRHSEPFELLKSIRDIANEPHQHGIKYAKTGIKGAMVGSVLGYTYFIGAP
jgi:hypothetical protein|tara:strand:- start:625 stop:945 length:321 start_codon:yes stop_codon:yes gene_type:complete